MKCSLKTQKCSTAQTFFAYSETIQGTVYKHLLRAWCNKGEPLKLFAPCKGEPWKKNCHKFSSKNLVYMLLYGVDSFSWQKGGGHVDCWCLKGAWKIFVIIFFIFFFFFFFCITPPQVFVNGPYVGICEDPYCEIANHRMLTGSL